MWGTLEEGDCLWVSRVPFDSLQAGDVVAFHSGDKVVAHRIVERADGGFWTRGDGNWGRDSAPLTSERLIGKVVERERRGVRTVVAGGERGRRRALVLRTAFRFRLYCGFPLAASYRLLRASRIVPRLWRPRILAVCFVLPAGPITKFIHRGKTVASWWPRDGQWNCKMPYDLVLSPPE